MLSLVFFSHQFMLFICVFISIFVGLIFVYIFFNNFYNTIFFTHFYLEFFWTFFPILLVLLLFLPLFYFSDLFYSATLNIFFLANQWFWEFFFNDSFYSNDSLNFSLNTDISLFLPSSVYFNFYFTSADVLHAFSLPELYVMTDCVPGLLSLSSINFPMMGYYTVYCAQICGINHSMMPFYFYIN